VDSKAQLIHGLDWCSSLIAAFPASDSNVSFRLRACLTKQAVMQAGTCRALDNDRHCSFCVGWTDNELGESIGHRVPPRQLNKKEKMGLVNNQLDN